MRASDFARHLSRIHSRAKHGGSTARANRCARALIRRTGAAPIIHAGKVIAYRLPGGSIACEKQRFRDPESAGVELARIRRTSAHSYIPVRAYRCDLCGGWHLASKAKGIP